MNFNCLWRIAAEQKARTTYDNILRLADDPDVRDPIKFLREREIVHFQRFGEAKREVSSKYPGSGKPTPTLFCNRKYKNKKYIRCMDLSRLQGTLLQIVTSSILLQQNDRTSCFQTKCTAQAAFLTPHRENRNAAIFMPSCYAVGAEKALIYAASRTGS